MFADQPLKFLIAYGTYDFSCLLTYASNLTGRSFKMGNIILDSLGNLESDLRAQNDFFYIYDIYYYGSASEQLVPINNS